MTYAPMLVPPDCSAPDGGWPGDIPDSIEGETALRRLADLIENQPDAFSGYYRTVLNPADPESDRLTVVGATGDVKAALDELGLTYPYNLCVVPVTLDGAALELIAERLERPPARITNVRPEIGRVVLSLPYFIDTTLAELGVDARSVVVDPLVRPLN
ncbi:MAG TPA: hypothetical protein VMZ33_04200 [Candidatus Limnocylindrales bacterium]|nr:hypothetical protein [Candidatus Limnocylindrales bacterium]